MIFPPHTQNRLKLSPNQLTILLPFTKKTETIILTSSHQSNKPVNIHINISLLEMKYILFPIKGYSTCALDPIFPFPFHNVFLSIVILVKIF